MLDPSHIGWRARERVEVMEGEFQGKQAVGMA
jgi:hypothetical protein